MGAGQSLVTAQAGVDSVLTPGILWKVIQTSEMDQHTNFEQFWPALLQTFKTLYKQVPNFKDGAVIEQSDVMFDVISSQDGSKNEPPLPFDPTTRNTYILDKEQGTIYNEIRSLPFNLLETCSITKVGRKPLQVEFWRQFIVKNSRRAGAEIAGYAQSVVSSALGREIKFDADQKSPLIPDALSAVSEPLDDFTTMDDLWVALLKVFVSQQYNKYLVGETKVTENEASAESFTLTISGTSNGHKMVEDGIPVPDVDELSYFGRLLAFHPLHHLTFQMHTENFTLMEIYHFTVFADPLRVDAWSVLPTPPLADEDARTCVETCVNDAINRAMDE
mmetsp:Transcript_106934/g.312706  ORF Transcript_106934/g.312706 Transcript_106934/m.312706 type:complete len:333 (-) Transcript_106934:124-1122(-)